MKLLFVFNTLIKSSSLLFGFIISVFVTHYFGSAALGLYVLFVTLLNLLLIVVRGGQDRLLIKELADNKANSRKILSEAFILVLLMGSFASVLVITFIGLGMIKAPALMSVTQFVIFLAFSALACGIMSIVVVTLRARNYVTQANMLEGLPLNILLLLGLALVVLIVDFPSPTLPIFLYSLVAFLVATGSVIYLKNKFAWQLELNNLDIVNRFKLGLPFMLIFGTTSLNTSIDTLMVNYYLSIEEVAYYNVALKLSSLIQLGLVISTSLIIGKMAKLYQSKQIKQLRLVIRQSIYLSLSLAMVIILLYGIAVDDILSLWGAEFTLAKQPLYILVLAQFINVCFGPLGVMLTVLGKEKQVLLWSIGTLLINTLGNFILVPYLGITGAAISTACAVVIENLVFYGIVKYFGLLNIKLADKAAN